MAMKLVPKLILIVCVVSGIGYGANTFIEYRKANPKQEIKQDVKEYQQQQKKQEDVAWSTKQEPVQKKVEQEVQSTTPESNSSSDSGIANLMKNANK